MNSNFEKIDINDIPSYSNWPARIIGINKWDKKRRDHTQVVAEYQKKWGKLLKRYKSMTYKDLQDVITDLFIDHFPKTLLFHINEDLYFSKTDDSFWKYINSYIDTIMTSYCNTDDTIVELGSGWGRNLFSFLQRKICLKVIGGEYTDDGVELAKAISNDQGIPAQFFHFDYNDPNSQVLKMVNNAIVFTHNSIEQIPYLKKETFETLISYKPKAVIHFEPVFEYRNKDTMIHYLWKRYTEINDYNRDLLTILKELESEGKIKIVEEKIHALGLNAFNPGSFIVWKVV